MELRIGSGVDLHRLVPGDICHLGGIELRCGVVPEAHSDGDVILHALMDALLGAVGERDIGFFFPNSEARWHDASSVFMLQEVWKIVSAGGWRINNLDISVICERPKIADHVELMKNIIARELFCAKGQVAIKATTAERLGALGRGEGIMSMATVLLIRD